jgi:nicotinamide-nucleotide amidase
MKKIIQAATKNGITITTAESCTGGMVASALTSISGASAVFETGFITYANAAKTKLLGVPEPLIKKHGAVSKQVAAAMAEGARKKADATIAISITGIAGPVGGTIQKPIGTVFIAVATSQKITVEKYHFSGTRAQIRKQATSQALIRLLQTVKPWRSERG